MGSFNKTISFILGLIVIIVLFAFISKRLKLGEKINFLPLADKKVTAVPTPRPTTTPSALSRNIPAVTVVPTRTPTLGRVQQPQPTTTSIPNTGPGLILPAAFGTLLAGIYLRKKL